MGSGCGSMDSCATSTHLLTYNSTQAAQQAVTPFTESSVSQPHTRGASRACYITATCPSYITAICPCSSMTSLSTGLSPPPGHTFPRRTLQQAHLPTRSWQTRSAGFCAPAHLPVQAEQRTMHMSHPQTAAASSPSSRHRYLLVTTLETLRRIYLS